MKAIGALPSEDRVQKMNDAQWLWCYLNELEDQGERLELEDAYLTGLHFAINPDYAKKVVEYKDKYKKGIKKNKIDKKYHEEESQLGEDKIVVTKEPIYSTEFEKELAEAMKGVEFTELPGDNFVGSNESEEEFLGRVIAMEQKVQKENEVANQQQNKIESKKQDIIQELIDNDLDWFEISDDDDTIK